MCCSGQLHVVVEMERVKNLLDVVDSLIWIDDLSWLQTIYDEYWTLIDMGLQVSIFNEDFWYCCKKNIPDFQVPESYGYSLYCHHCHMPYSSCACFSTDVASVY